MTSPSRGMPCPSCASFHTLEIEKRAQGRPGAGRTHGPPANKKAGGRRHRIGRTSGLPCAMVLTVSFALSPGTGLSCSRREQIVLLTWPQRREARTTRLRRPHRLVRPRAKRAAIRCVHRIPWPTFVTIAKRPSCGHGTVHHASDFWESQVRFRKSECVLLRRIGTTGSLSMARLQIVAKNVLRAYPARAATSRTRSPWSSSAWALAKNTALRPARLAS